MRNAHESNRWEDRVVDNGIEAKGSRWKFVLVQLAGVSFFFLYFLDEESLARFWRAKFRGRSFQATGEKDGCPFRGTAVQSCRKRNEGAVDGR